MKGQLEELTVEELDKELDAAKEAVRVARFNSVTGNLQNPKVIRDSKKKIARILTLKNEYKHGIREKK